MSYFPNIGEKHRHFGALVSYSIIRSSCISLTGFGRSPLGCVYPQVMMYKRASLMAIFLSSLS